MTDPNTAPVYPPAPPAPEAKPKRPWYKRKRIIIPAAVIVGFGFIGAIANPPSDEEPVAASTPVAAADKPAATAEPVEEEKVMVKVPDVVGGTVSAAYAALTAAGFDMKAPGAKEDWIVTEQSPAAGREMEEGSTILLQGEKPKPKTTVSQDAALSKAQDYMDYAGFSRKGLIDQLKYEQFSTDDATWAADHGNFDWMEAAERKAADYMDYSSFSRGGLIDQLVFEGFTKEQAAHGADSVGL